jgi:ABC-2 type transport system ATP-binding protein
MEAHTAAGISLSGLSKTFRGPKGPVHAVRDVDVEIEHGETVALLGPNGAGKSTTIDMMLGLLPPDAGTVSLFRRDPHEAIAAGSVGAMLQTGEITGLGDVADQRTQKLSGGQTQRVRFAIALAPNPQLLVLDEPTVAMDVEGRQAFWSSMRGLTDGGTTIVFATHYMEEADANADRAILMAHGRIVADGPTTEIKGMVGSRTIRATLPGASIDELRTLPGVASADRHGEAVILNCEDSDAAIRALLQRYPAARDIEISGAGLEQAFLQLTSEPEEVAA